MKSKLKKIVIPIFLAVICGTLCGRLMFNIYEEKGSSTLNSNVIYCAFSLPILPIKLVAANLSANLSLEYLLLVDILFTFKSVKPFTPTELISKGA